MPITPHFSLSQTDTHILLDISVPHVRVTLDSMHVALSERNCRLHWSCPPYYLVLNFERAFHETAAELAEVDTASTRAIYEPTIQNGILRISLAKAEPGTEWTDLDLVGRLMNRKTEPASSHWIQQVTHTEGSDGADTAGEEDGTAWTIQSNGYGFLRLFRNIFTDWTRDGLAKEMYEAPWQETSDHGLDESSTYGSTQSTSIRTHRRQLRRQMEQDKFDADRYLHDIECQDDYLYMCAMSMRPHWTTNKQSDDVIDQLQNLSLEQDDQGNQDSFFTRDESIQLTSIPYPLLPPNDQICEYTQDGLLLGLSDILFAYVYDHIMTEAEPTVESAWTISYLSASLSWLEDWLDDLPQNEPLTDNSSALENVIVSSIRRSLIYPYLRNLDLSVKIWQHVGTILTRGRRTVLRCMLQIRDMLHRSELYYLNNKLFIDPYLAWLQIENDGLEMRMTLLGQLIQSKLPCVDDSLRDKVGLGLAEIENTIWEEYSQTDEVSNDSSERIASANDPDEDEDGESDDEDDNESTNGTENEIGESLNVIFSAEREMNQRIDNSTSKISTELLDDYMGSSPLLLSDATAPGTLSLLSDDSASKAKNGPVIEIIDS